MTSLINQLEQLSGIIQGYGRILGTLVKDYDARRAEQEGRLAERQSGIFRRQASIYQQTAQALQGLDFAEIERLRAEYCRDPASASDAEVLIASVARGLTLTQFIETEDLRAWLSNHRRPQDE